MWVALAFLGSAVLIHILNNKRQSQLDIDGGGDLFEESAPATPRAGAVDHASLLEGLAFELR